jgi:hypothetical protein
MYSQQITGTITRTRKIVRVRKLCNRIRRLKDATRLWNWIDHQDEPSELWDTMTRYMPWAFRDPDNADSIKFTYDDADHEDENEYTVHVSETIEEVRTYTVRAESPELAAKVVARRWLVDVEPPADLSQEVTERGYAISCDADRYAYELGTEVEE